MTIRIKFPALHSLPAAILFSLLLSPLAMAQVFINEIHYDNAGGMTGEGDLLIAHQDQLLQSSPVLREKIQFLGNDQDKHRELVRLLMIRAKQRMARNSPIKLPVTQQNLQLLKASLSSDLAATIDDGQAVETACHISVVSGHSDAVGSRVKFLSADVNEQLQLSDVRRRRHVAHVDDDEAALADGDIGVVTGQRQS